jgi:hypothetical protein
VNDDDGDNHGGQLLQSTQSTDDGFAEDILESSDVLIKEQITQSESGNLLVLFRFSS